MIWTDEAVHNVDAIWNYIREFNAPAATRMVLRLRSIAETLAEHAERGKALGGDVRRLTTPFPYLMRYRITPEAIYILNVRHGARRPD